jgi:uncharacterized protein involved in outer membrane biogenesis
MLIMTWNIKRPLLISVAVLAILLTGFGFGVIPINLFFLKTAISEAAREQLGAELGIEGPLRLRLGFSPSLSASLISLSAPGAAGQPLAAIGKLTIRPRLLKLFHGDILLRGVEASGIVLDYCPQRFPEPGAAPAESGPEGRQWPEMAVEQLSLKQIRLQCRQPDRALEFLPEMLELQASAALNMPVSLEIISNDAENKMKLSVSGASLTELLADPEVYPLDLRFSAFSAEIRVAGSILQPLRDARLQARLEAGTDNLSDMLANFGMVVPGLDVLSIQSELRASGNEVHLSDFEGSLNEIPFRLSGLVRDFTSRPWLEIDAEFTKLDLARFTGEKDQPATDEESAFADLQPLYDGLSLLDGRATLHIGQLLNASIAIEQLDIEASLDHGRLSLDHVGLQLAGSEVTAQAALDTGLDCARLDTQLNISDFDLGNLNPLLETESVISGRIDQLRLATSSCGVSFDQHVRSLQANAELNGLNPRLDDEEPPLELNRLEAEIGWNEPGELSFDGKLLGEKLSATIGFGSLDSIRSGARSPLTISAKGEEFRASIQGDGAIREDRLLLDVILAADVSSMGSLHGWLGTTPDSRLSFTGRTAVRLDDAGLSISNLDAALGRSDLRGSLSWAGPDSTRPMSLDLKSTRLDLGEIAELFPGTSTPEQRVQPEWSELLDKNDWVERWFGLPAIDIDFDVGTLAFVKAEVNRAKLHANLRDRLIEDGQLSLQFESVDFEGALEADLREQPWTIDYQSVLGDMDIGRMLSALDLAENVDAQAQSANIHYRSEGDSLRQLAVNSRVESTIEGLHWAFTAGPKQHRFDINLSELEVIAAPFTKTTWQTSGNLNGSPLKAWMQTPPLPTTFDPAVELPLTLVVGSGDNVTMLDVVVDPASQDGVGLSLVISGDFTNAGSVDFASLASPLDDYEFRADLKVKKSEFLNLNLDARIGTSRATGSIDIQPEGPGYRFDVDLGSPFLETDDLVQWTADFRNAQQIVSGENIADDAQQNVNAGVLKLADQYITEFSGQNILNLHAAVDELRSSGRLLGKAELEMKIEGEEFRLDPVRIELPGGNVDAHYSGNYIDGGYEYALDLNIERLEYGGLLRLFDPDSKGHGEIFMDTSLVSRSPDAAHAVNHLKGHVDLAVFPEDIEAGFLDLWASNLIFALLPKGESSGKKLNCMVARFDVVDGVMKSKNTFLDSTEIIVRARGDIDLVNRQVDLMVAPQAKLEKFLSVSTPIAVTGPFDDFKAGVAPGGFLATVFRWYYGLIYVPWKWLTGEHFPPDGIATCYKAMEWELP